VKVQKTGLNSGVAVLYIDIHIMDRLPESDHAKCSRESKILAKIMEKYEPRFLA
jgi:hypothetical protein